MSAPECPCCYGVPTYKPECPKHGHFATLGTREETTFERCVRLMHEVEEEMNTLANELAAQPRD